MITSERDIILQAISQWRRLLKPSFTEITIIEEILDDEPLVQLPHRQVKTHIAKGFILTKEEGAYNTRKASIGNTIDQSYSRISNIDIYVYDFFIDDLLIPKTQVALKLTSGERIAVTVETIDRTDDGNIYLFGGCINPTEEIVP